MSMKFLALSQPICMIYIKQPQLRPILCFYWVKINAISGSFAIDMSCLSPPTPIDAHDIIVIRFIHLNHAEPR